jgi:hypothetical protein
MVKRSWILSWQSAVAALIASMAVLAALTLIPLEDKGLIVLGVALLVAAFDVVLAVRCFSNGFRKRGVVGVIGFLVVFAGPVATRILVDSMWASQAERQGLALLQGTADVAGLGKLRALEGSGHEITKVFWDIGGASGHLVLLRRGRFESGDIPVVIVAHRMGSSPVKPGIALERGSETLLKYTEAHKAPEGNAALGGSVVVVVTDCPRPIP